MEQEAERVITEYVDRFRSRFRDPKSLSRDEHGVVLCAYGTDVSRIFVSLMTLAYSHGTVPAAQELLWGNVVVEVDQNHIAMLRRFAASTSAYADDDRVQRILQENHPVIEDLFRLILHGPVAAGFALMALWESLSVVFMDEIRYAGEILQSPDSEYPDKHGEFDKDHARDCITALAIECQERSVPLPTEVLDLGYQFMANIFCFDLA